MAQRDTIQRGSFRFPKQEWQIAHLVAGTFAVPLVFWAFFSGKLFSKLERAVLEAALVAIDTERENQIRRKQLPGINLVQGTYLKNRAETIFMRWRPWGFVGGYRNPIKDMICEAAILATVRFKVGTKVVNADIVCSWGTLMGMDFDADIYEYLKSSDLEIIEVDSEAVEVDHQGRFVRSLG